MKKAAVCVIAVIAIIHLLGCGSGGGGEDVLPAQRYFPLSQGNWWRYEVTDYTVGANGSSSGLRIRLPLSNRAIAHAVSVTSQQGEPGIGLATTSLTGVVSIGGSNWYEATTTLHDSGLDPTMQYFRHDGNGLANRTTQASASYYRIRAPIEPGTTWNPPFGANDESEIMSVTAATSVPAGDFTDCLLVHEAWDGDEGRIRVVSWFAEDLGLVRSEDYVDDDLTGKAELSAYGVASH